MIATAIEWARTHAEVFKRVARIFINLSRDSVVDPETGEFIRQSLAASGVDPRCIGFETAENIAIGNLGKANALIVGLRRIGCSFALDDFGSGVSSFAYLKALSVDYLKIDGMFIGNMSQDRVDYAMVRSIKEIGHVMGKVVVAESVESEAAWITCARSASTTRRGSPSQRPGRSRKSGRRAWRICWRSQQRG